MDTIELNNLKYMVIEEILKNDLKEALQEVKDIEAGKVKALTMDDLYAELENVQ